LSKRNSKIVILYSVLFTFIACDNLSLPFSKADELDQGEPIARVYDQYLYENDIEGLITPNMSSEDSAAFIGNFISLWAKEQLLINKAEYNLSANDKDFQRQIEDYRNDLLTFKYKKAFVAERIDTLISLENIKAYYKEHSDNFLLKENIVRADYIVINSEAPQLKNAKKWFKSTKEEEQASLKSYAQKYAREFSLGDTSWISFDVLAQKVPVETYNQVGFLSRNKVVEFKQNNLLYLLRIKGYKIADSSSPLPYVQNIIKSIILNQRKQALLEELEKKLLEDALSNDEFETF
jgi:hypothetical protein